MFLSIYLSFYICYTVCFFEDYEHVDSPVQKVITLRDLQKVFPHATLILVLWMSEFLSQQMF